jgi:hypothetical protein
MLVVRDVPHRSYYGLPDAVRLCDHSAFELIQC